MREMMKALLEAKSALRNRYGDSPDLAVALGSGYSWLGEEIDGVQETHYRNIPHFPLCTNPKHPGALVVGEFCGHSAVFLLGRIHCYEGYRADEVAFVVRALALWGVKTFVLTNAAGAINPAFEEGEFMALSDHINLLGQNPLTGRNLDELGTRFPDLSTLYTPQLREDVVARVEKHGVHLHVGVYGAMTGPSYETPAEIRVLQRMGADAVGMSTVPEAIALGHMGRQVFGLSCLTNLAAGKSTKPLDDEDIAQVLDRKRVRATLMTILKEVFDATRRV